MAPCRTKNCSKAGQESSPILSAPKHVLTIREIAVSDAAAAAQLSGELGYPSSPEVMAQRIEQLQHSPHHVVYVACLSETVVAQNTVAWIDLSISHHLQSEPYCEIGGLVVSSSFRGNSIGRQLVAQAEQWAKQQGVSKMLVRSRVTREAAHRFYLRERYTQEKISAVFTKQLS